MKTVIIFLHRKIDSLILSKQLSSHLTDVNIIVVPPTEIDHSLQYHVAQSSLITHLMNECRNIQPSEVVCVVFEANYGLGGTDIFCDEIYRSLKNAFFNAEFIAYSSTVGSLNLALQTNNKLLICYNVHRHSENINYFEPFSPTDYGRITLRQDLSSQICQILEQERNERKENQAMPKFYGPILMELSEIPSAPIPIQFSPIPGSPIPRSSSFSASSYSAEEGVVPMEEEEEGFANSQNGASSPSLSAERRSNATVTPNKSPGASRLKLR